MGFDDLAKHMAKRDGKKHVAGSADQIVAEAAAADRRMTRTRDLILGPILLIGGLVGGIFIALYLYDAFDPKPHRLRPPETSDTFLVPIGASVFCVGMLITGVLQTIRGLRGRGREVEDPIARAS